MKSLTKKLRLVSVGVAAGLTLGLVGTAAAVTSSSSTVRSSPAAPYIACATRQRVLKIMQYSTCASWHFRGDSWCEGRNWREGPKGRNWRERREGSNGCATGPTRCNWTNWS
jgi:hypothetical protein